MTVMDFVALFSLWIFLSISVAAVFSMYVTTHKRHLPPKRDRIITPSDWRGPLK